VPNSQIAKIRHSGSFASRFANMLRCKMQQTPLQIAKIDKKE